MSGEILCDECLDTGWLEDREGRVVCSCVGETEPYQQMQAENERLRDLIKDMSRAIDCLSAGLPLRDLDEILLRVWKVQGAGE